VGRGSDRRFRRFDLVFPLSQSSSSSWSFSIFLILAGCDLALYFVQWFSHLYPTLTGKAQKSRTRTIGEYPCSYIGLSREQLGIEEVELNRRVSLEVG
jgi:hypothetical protein